jgi:hypothetical protein
MNQIENEVIGSRVVLLCLNDNHHPDLELLKQEFCGRVITSAVCSLNNEDLIYVAGDIPHDLPGTVFIIDEFCEIENCSYPVVSHLQVPRRKRDCLWIPHFFPDKDYFHRVTQEHQLLPLTESKKPGVAHRTGRYFSKGNEANTNEEYHLMRCSTNMAGPTQMFTDTDHEITNQVQGVVDTFFREKVDMNHVLAQVYWNQKVKKARISAHSDKTKDMPHHAVIAFCTFYDSTERRHNNNRDPNLQWSRLLFRSKADPSDTFTIILFPGSLFIIPLSVNRMYTHEIVPSELPSEQLPTRLGYVVRCSKTRAKWMDDATHIWCTDSSTWKKMMPLTNEDERRIRQWYLEENTGILPVKYPPLVLCSMNQGDYLQRE